MHEYVSRLIRCGYSENRAYEVCESFVKNLPLIDLEFFVSDIERHRHVEGI